MNKVVSNNEFVLINDNTTNDVILNRQINGIIETPHTIDVQEDFGNFEPNDMMPLPALGEECIAEFLYTDGVVNWCCIQTHNRTADDPVNIPALFRQYRKQGEPWVQPTDEWDAYNVGDWVLYTDSKYYKSNIHANVWAPDAYPTGWDECDENGNIVIPEPEPEIEVWESGKTYNTDDLVYFPTETDPVYKSLIDNNVWSPTAYPAGWEEQADAVVTEPIEDWIQPTGGHDAYNTGDKVKFEGNDYESVIDNNVWSPTAYPAGWNQL